MTTYEWSNALDWSKIKTGDILQGGYGRPTYVADIHARSNSKPNLISPEFSIELVEYSHSFESKKVPGAGYGFSCLRDGSFLSELDEKRFAEVKADPEYTYQGIETYERHFNEPAIIRCTGWNPKTRKECGNEVALEMVMTNSCDVCHTDYNSSGQRLAPREQWGWDTGETLDEILASDFGINDPIPGREYYDD